MKKLLLPALILTAWVQAHDHVEVGKSSQNPSQLVLDGPIDQLALFVPQSEPFSGYAPNFPGGYFACELTFTTEVDALDPAYGSDPVIELVSVTGPAGAFFSFWESGSTTPTWSRFSGWNQTESDRPSFPVILGGETHAHGRIFTADRPGDYQIIFRARDKNNLFSLSTNFTMTFHAQLPPPLSIRLQDGQALISFMSREYLVYDLQICTDLLANKWINVEGNIGIDGNGLKTECPLPLNYPRAFFRIVEYY
jgi:hypothetical protein